MDGKEKKWENNVRKTDSIHFLVKKSYQYRHQIWRMMARYGLKGYR